MPQPVWTDELVRTIDAKDPDAFVAFLTEDGAFRFGNNPPACGRPAVRDAVAAFFSSVRALRHTVRDVWAHPDAVVMHGEVTYTRHDGSELTLPFANVLKMQGTLVREYLVFADVSRLWS